MKRQPNRWYKEMVGIGVVALCILLFLPALRFIPSEAQSPSTATVRPIEIESRIVTFFSALATGTSGSELAIDGLLRQSPYASDVQAVTALRSKVDECGQRFGKILHWEPYETKPIGTDILVVKYILKYEYYPFIWTFTFYKKPAGTSLTPTPVSPTSVTDISTWTLIELNFDSNFQGTSMR